VLSAVAAITLITSGAEPWLTRRLKELYEPWLNRAVRVVAIGDGGRRGRADRCAGCTVFDGRSFLPEFNEGALTVSAVTIPGTSLQDSNALGNALERLLLSVPEVPPPRVALDGPNSTNTCRASSRLRSTCASR
jgi:Cu/Ag efflux pump CusA